MLAPLGRRIDKLKICIIMTLSLILFSGAVNAISEFTLRKEIYTKFQSIDWAKNIVVKYALAGDLSGISGDAEIRDNSVSISASSGVIAVSFPGVTQGSLMLLPIVSQSGLHYPLKTFLMSDKKLKPEMIYWLCTAGYIRARETYIQQNVGTLPIELAPQECRHVEWIGFDLSP